MKTTLPAMDALLDGGVISLAMLMTIRRRDGQVARLTDYDRPVKFGGNTYQPQAGLKRSALSVSEGLGVDSMEVEGYYDGILTEESMRKGKFDAAEVDVVFCEASSPDTYGAIGMFYGFVGDMKRHRDKFTLSVNGFTVLLQQELCEVTSPDCRANLGDARCKVNMTPHTYTGTITGIVSANEYTVSVSQPAGRFTYGTVEFTSGLNIGAVIEIKDSPTGRIKLFLPPEYTVSVGDAITLMAGCDKTATTCANVYNNIINFQGEPHLPGLTPLTESASRLI